MRDNSFLGSASTGRRSGGGLPRICIVRRRISTTAAAQTILVTTSRGTFWRIKRHLQVPRPPWSDRRLSRRGGKTRTMRRVRSTEDVNRSDARCGKKTRLSWGLKPRDPWRKRGGKQQKLDPCYNREEQGEGQGQGLGNGSAAMDSSLAVALWTAALPLLQRLCRYGCLVQQPCLRRAPPRTRVGWRGRDEVVLPPCQRIREARGCSTAHPAA